MLNDIELLCSGAVTIHPVDIMVASEIHMNDGTGVSWVVRAEWWARREKAVLTG